MVMRDDRVPPDPRAGQPAGHRDGLRLQLGVVERVPVRDHGDRSGQVSARCASQLSSSIGAQSLSIVRAMPNDTRTRRPRRTSTRRSSGATTAATTRTSSTSAPRAWPRSRSTGPRSTTPSGLRRCASCATRSPAPATTSRSRRSSSPAPATEAFCSGGDQRIRGDDGYIGDDEVAEQGVGRLDVGDLHVQIRRLPKPVVAMVAGYAVGGGHILHLVCDMTIAGDNAQFGQTGPRVGSFDGGFGASLLARNIGVKKAKEFWFLCRLYDGRGGARDGARQRGGARSPISSGRPSPGAARWPPSPPCRCGC